MEMDFNDEDLDGEIIEQGLPTTTTQDNEPSKGSSEEDFITGLLRDRGIDDPTQIKYEEDGVIKNVNWDDLPDSEKLNIIRSTSTQQKTENDFLDDNEIKFINEIRNSGMSPDEYMEYMNRKAADNMQNTVPSYTVDQFDDDTLFVTDFMSTVEGATEEDAKDALEAAKVNETLWGKQIKALRDKYKTIEDESNLLMQAQQEQEQRQQLQQFADSVVNSINEFTDFSGYDINLDDDDKQEIYDFITSSDAVGNNYFSKALADPNTLVKTAWLTLHAEDMINDLTKYYTDQISKARQAGYNKGLKDGQNSFNNVVYNPKRQVTDTVDDLDDF